MTFQAFLPDPALQPYIRTYWLITGTQEQPGPIELLPDGGVTLLLNLGEGIHSDRFGRQWNERGTLIVGAMTAGDTQMLLGETLLFGITFKPGGFTHLHCYDPMDRIAEGVVPFDKSRFPDPDMILRHGSRFLDRFYLERVAHPRYSLLPVVSDIERHQGLLRMDDLMHRHCTTGRQLERQFKQQIGISPKEYIGIIRFNHAFGVVQREQGARSLMDIAWDCGYYDHAHMTADFKRRMGRTPSAFVLSDNSKIIESAPR
jgi:AraC-like DNA-binding protein